MKNFNFDQFKRNGLNGRIHGIISLAKTLNPFNSSYHFGLWAIVYYGVKAVCGDKVSYDLSDYVWGVDDDS